MPGLLLVQLSSEIAQVLFGGAANDCGLAHKRLVGHLVKLVGYLVCLAGQTNEAD